jgi:NAD(P)-dependent dehydrogenase (short-subunit alcohol dehydrogenase family)
MAVILVTGSSTGISQEAVIHLAQCGHRVFASCRNPATATELNDRITASGLDIEVLPLDLLDQATITRCVDSVIAKAGRIDVLVSNAGIGAGGALEETPLETIKEVYESNVFGTLAVMQTVIPHLRKQGSGRLVNVTSLAAVNVFGCHGTYSSSKAAMEAMCTALSQELAQFNIEVSLIEPGCVMTPMWTKGEPPAEDTPYTRAYERIMGFGTFGLGRAASTIDCAEAITDAIESEQPQFRYPVGPDAEDFFKAYRAMNDDEQWRQIARLDNDAYAEKMLELMGVDYYR